ENGLVDALGGYDTALRLARDAAKIAADQPFTLTVFPREKGTVELIYDHLFGAGEREEAVTGTLARSVAALRAAAGAGGAAAPAPRGPPMPPPRGVRQRLRPAAGPHPRRPPFHTASGWRISATACSGDVASTTTRSAGLPMATP